jgi:hypothetical protein
MVEAAVPGTKRTHEDMVVDNPPAGDEEMAVKK